MQSSGRISQHGVMIFTKKKQKIFGRFTANIEIRLPSGIIAELLSLKNNHQSHLQNNLFAQTLRYAQNFILGISCICLR
jgi:hypothetical protein